MNLRTILQKTHEKLHWEGYFFFIVLLLLISTTGLDHIVTSVIKPDITRPVFSAYILWHFLYNQAVAWLGVLFGWHATRSKYDTCLIYVTLLWVWIGGALDILYFMIHGAMLPLSEVMWWILPWWTFRIHVAYTCTFFVLLLYLWWIHFWRKSDVESRKRI